MMNPNSLPFSKKRRHGDTLYLSGEMPFAEDGSIPEGIEAQTDLTLQRIAATLAEEGLTLADVVSCTVHLADRADFAAFNAVYAKHFPEPRPVRTTVEARLMVDARVEITVIAKFRD
jgi:2-iminobutanoate/2-iminopropanoate deaminase